MSCLYKILSRVINNRLKTFSGKLLSRAQKGFTKKRNIQECLINLTENIAHCKKNNIKGALVALDQMKAFDTVSNKYMSEVYKFFGFGYNMITMMETLGNNRTACIILEDNSFSKNFNLGKGRPQGDPPSPLQYNLAEQILLFKLELSNELQPLIPVNQNIVFPPQEIGKEMNRETSVADAFADDTSLIILATYKNLPYQILGHFLAFTVT